MYRAVTYYFLQNDIDYTNNNDLDSILGQINIRFEKKEDGGQNIFLNEKNISTEIRSKQVNDHVSPVATISKVRRFLVEQQRGFRTNQGIVMDGRDIGTVVFPNAELKLFLKANIDVRTIRRFLELQENKLPLDYETVKSNLQKRDLIDSSREDSPLTIAENAIVFDTSYLSKKEQFLMIYVLALSRINGPDQINLRNAL